MFTTLFGVLVFAGACSAEYPYTWRCEEGTGKNVSVQPTDVEGSYVVTYCAPVISEESHWELRVSSLQVKQEKCVLSSINERRPSTRHSYLDVVIEPTNCSRVCVSTQLYLLYRSCYRLENKLQSKAAYNAYFFADNQITGPEYFCNGSLFFHNYLGSDTPTLYLYQGRMPVNEYSITIVSNSSASHYEEQDVSPNCTSLLDAVGLRCSLAVPVGCYDLYLQQAAPWFDHHYYSTHCRVLHQSFCREGEEPSVSSSGSWVWVYGLLGGCVAGAAAATALVLARRSRLARKLTSSSQRVIDLRRNKLRSAAEAAALARAAHSGNGRVLLLYARDCPPAQRAADALRELLEIVAPLQVDDIYSEEVVALSAHAPYEWVRASLAAGARVVLLQTPALALLHRPRAKQLADGACWVSEPLLPAHVVYRSPHPSDALLQFALRLMADRAPTAPYRQHYLATLSSVPVEIFPTVVPFTRYVLPSAASALLQELSGDPASPPATLPPQCIAALSAADADLAAYVRDNQNYLADELMFL